MFAQPAKIHGINSNGAILYFSFDNYLNKEVLSWVCILGAIPFAGLGFFKYNGMPLEQFIKAYMKSEMLVPKNLKFVSENIYERYYELLQNFKKVEDKKSSKFIRTIAIDFDGVIHSYLSKFVSEEVIPDEPVESIADLLNKLKDKYKIVVFSTRASTKRGKNAIINYMNEKGLYFDEVTNIKPAAFLYVDDRAIQFNGDCDKLYNDIVSFKRPWNK